MGKRNTCRISPSYCVQLCLHVSCRSHEERKQAITLTRKTLDDNGFQKTLVIAGTGAQSTRETKKLCIDAKEAGASHVLVLTPSTWPPQMTKENILRFHREVRFIGPYP